MIQHTVNIWNFCKRTTFSYRVLACRNTERKLNGLDFNLLNAFFFLPEIKNEPEIEYDFSVYFGFIMEKFKKFAMPMFSSMFPKSGLTNLVPIFHLGLKSPLMTESWKFDGWEIFKLFGNFSLCCEVRVISVRLWNFKDGGS